MDVCQEYNLSKSTVGIMWKNRDSIISAHDKNLDAKKTLRKAEHKHVEEVFAICQYLDKCFKQRPMNLPNNLERVPFCVQMVGWTGLRSGTFLQEKLWKSQGVFQHLMSRRGKKCLG